MSARAILLTALVTTAVGCGHTLSSPMGLASVGDLEGRQIPSIIEGPVVEGEDCGGFGGTPYFLSEAVRNALLGTTHDTLVNMIVINRTGVLVTSNCIEVVGTAISSQDLPRSGDQ